MQLSHFTELTVYPKAVELTAQMFCPLKALASRGALFPDRQIRRAARSVGANIPEAWGKRRHQAHFVCKLTDADGGNHEVEPWLITARGAGYPTAEEFNDCREQKREVGRMLGSLIQNPGPFLLK
ncbi:MAG: four helix bundle protein [Verrucomicrobiota bacterium]